MNNSPLEKQMNTLRAKSAVYNRIGRAGLCLRLALAAACFLLARSAAFAESQAKPGAPAAPGIQEFKLPDGLTVLTKEVHAAPVVCTYVWYRVGSRNETPGVTGVSHQLEHMMFKGTKKLFPTPGYIDYLLGQYGGQNNASTDYDATAYYLLLPKDQLDLALRVEADRMTGAAIDPKQLTAEKTVVLSELEGDENDNGYFLYETTRSAAFQFHPYHYPVIGTKWDVQHFTRAQVYDYYQRHYAPNNATLVLVGDFDTAKVMARVRELWQSVPAHDVPHPPLNPEPVQKGERRVIVRRAGAAPYLDLFYHIPNANSPDIAPLTVLGTALTGGRSSRLYRALVETQLATNVSAGANQNIDPTTFDVSISVRAGVAPESVEKPLLAEIQRVQDEPLTPRELEKARNQARADFVFAQESVDQQAARIGYYQTVTGDWRNMTRFLDKINGVSAADVQRVARQYLIGDNRTVGTFLPAATSAPPAEAGASVGSPVAHYKQAGNREQGARRNSRQAETGSNINKSLVAPQTLTPTTGAAMPKAAQRKLANGVTVIVRENHANPTVTIGGFVRAGSQNDPAGKFGLANVTADLLTRGAGERTSQQIAEATDFVGASLSANAERQRTTFTAVMLRDNYALMLGLLADVLQRPTFPADELEKVRGETLSDLEEQANNTALVATRRLYDALYRAHPAYAHDPDGRAEDVRAIARDDVRAFYRQAFRPEATTIVVVGDVKAADVFDSMERAFGDWKGEGPAAFYSADGAGSQGENAGVTSSPDVIGITIPDKSQDDIAMGLVGPSRNAQDWEAASIMNLILGGDEFVGRVGKRVRDTEGLAYYAYTAFSPALDTGIWQFRAGVNPQRVPQAIRSAKDEVNKMLTGGVTAKELGWAKDHSVGALRLSLATNGGMAAQLENAAFFGLGLDYADRYPQIVRSLTKPQVDATAHKYLAPNRLQTVVVGPPVPGLNAPAPGSEQKQPAKPDANAPGGAK